MLERGECVATLDVADRIAQALGIKLENLIGEARRRLEAGTIVVPRRRRRR
jgi:ribosome-binding protein aMBF1 (putative translation factor)